MSTGVERWDGARLATARREAGLTQAALAAEIGVSWNSIARWERNERSPNVEHFAALLEKLSLRSASLLTARPEGPTMRDLRLAVPLSRAALADLMTYSPASISAIERGLFWPRDAARYAAALNVDVATLRRAWESSGR